MELSLTDILRRGANEAWHFDLTEAQIAQFARYADLLVDWNATRLNLTRLTSPSDIAVKHFLDSLAPLILLRIPVGASVIDIGAGAGLPGLAWKIARPDLRVTLLDSTAKKLAFCRAVADDLGLTDIQTLHGRAEEANRLPVCSAAFDVAVARAVAPLPRLLPWMAPFLSPRGLLVALKGASAADELADARPVARRLGLTRLQMTPIELPETKEPLLRQIVTAQAGPTTPIV